MLLIGSHALLSLTDGEHPDRRPRDVDVIGRGYEFDALVSRLSDRVRTVRVISDDKSVAVFDDGTILEWEFAWPGTAAARLLESEGPDRRIPLPVPTPLGDEVFATLPSLNVLLSLKTSHRYLKDSPHFWKTMADVRLLRALGARVHDTAWLKDRERETYARQKHPRLDVRKGDFFRGDGVDYVYDHDTIHLAVMHLDAPAYTFFKRPGSEVMCDRGLFEAAPMETRLLSVLEEAQVLALERSQIPHEGKATPEWSMRTALMKVCSSITSGWWREFAWEHHDVVWGMYLAEGRDTYVRRFRAALDAGVVLPHDPERKGAYG